MNSNIGEGECIVEIVEKTAEKETEIEPSIEESTQDFGFFEFPEEVLENVDMSELPENLTISSIAEFLDEKPTTIRRIVQDLEKVNMLSTSNKEANKHRQLCSEDLNIIMEVIALNRAYGYPYNKAIIEVETRHRTGIASHSLNEVFALTKRTMGRTAKIEDLLAEIVKYEESNGDKLQLYIQGQNDTIDIIKAQSEMINELQQSVKDMEQAINELKSSQEKKKKGIFGIFKN